MGKLYLIRHAHPDFPLGAHVCLGRTDTSLGPLGRMQARLLAEGLRDLRFSAVFCSPLARCRETAEPLGVAPTILEALAEQDMGPWDGLDFDTIRAVWPELYARRGKEPLLVPPGAETLEQVAVRVLPVLSDCLPDSTGDIAVVAHASVIQAILAPITGTALGDSRSLRPPYASFARIDRDGQLRLEQANVRPVPPLCPALAEALLEAAAPGERVVAHCRAVAAEALRLADALPLPLDRALLESAALLHDAARSEKDHAALGAAWLRDLGYDAAAALVEQHHDLRNEALDEAAILYLADKCVQEDRRVSVERRFADSEGRCRTEEARAAHARRREDALRLRDAINSLCGRRVVE